MKEGHFKAVFLDVGLMQNMCGSGSEVMFADDLMKVNAGAGAEQFVGQELLSYRDPYEPASLYYWVPEAATAVPRSTT